MGYHLEGTLWIPLDEFFAEFPAPDSYPEAVAADHALFHIDKAVIAPREGALFLPYAPPKAESIEGPDTGWVVIDLADFWSFVGQFDPTANGPGVHQYGFPRVATTDLVIDQVTNSEVSRPESIAPMPPKPIRQWQAVEEAWPHDQIPLSQPLPPGLTYQEGQTG